MAKHRKTRQEKMIADSRHISYHLETITAQDSPKRAQKSDFSLELPQTSTRTKTISYDYVTKDLRRTTLLTASIIIAQIILYIVLNRV
jgi:hypothetical protein